MARRVAPRGRADSKRAAHAYHAASIPSADPHQHLYQSDAIARTLTHRRTQAQSPTHGTSTRSPGPNTSTTTNTPNHTSTKLTLAALTIVHMHAKSENPGNSLDTHTKTRSHPAVSTCPLPCGRDSALCRAPRTTARGPAALHPGLRGAAGAASDRRRLWRWRPATSKSMQDKAVQGDVVRQRQVM